MLHSFPHSLAALEFTAAQITQLALAVIALFGLRVLMPLFGLVNRSREDAIHAVAEAKADAKAQVESNRLEIESLKADNRLLHERLGEQKSEQSQMERALSALETEVKYIKAANAELLTNNAKLEAENVSLRLSVVKIEADAKTQLTIRDHRIETLEDEVDEQLIFQDKPPKYDRPEAATTPSLEASGPLRFSGTISSPVTSPPGSPA
jgi:regulator of replication initiation timing